MIIQIKIGYFLCLVYYARLIIFKSWLHLTVSPSHSLSSHLEYNFSIILLKNTTRLRSLGRFGYCFVSYLHFKDIQKKKLIPEKSEREKNLYFQGLREIGRCARTI